MKNLTPDTASFLLHASQGDTSAAAKKLKDAKGQEQIEQVAKEFEAVFISEMMKPLFEGIEVDGMFGGGKGEEIFRGMMLQEYGKMLSQTGQIGISDAVKQQLIQLQEGRHADQ